MEPYEEFVSERESNIRAQGEDASVLALANDLVEETAKYQYSYNFEWMGRPIIQFPQDMVAMQELIWRIQPDVIVETGIAHGGSLIYTASLLAMLDYCDAAAAGESIDPSKPKRKVIGIDIDIRSHNRKAIEAHPMASRIEMLEGSSVAPGIVEEVRRLVEGKERMLVCLDSNHTHEHVLGELEAYAPLVSKGSYCVVFDTVVEKMPEGSFPNRPWDKGDNPWTAAQEYLKSHPEFEIDKSIPDKLLLTVAPDGFLKRMG